VRTPPAGQRGPHLIAYYGSYRGSSSTGMSRRGRAARSFSERTGATPTGPPYPDLRVVPEHVSSALRLYFAVHL
jgi:hypothetical protein